MILELLIGLLVVSLISIVLHLVGKIFWDDMFPMSAIAGLATILLAVVVIGFLGIIVILLYEFGSFVLALLA